MRGTLLRSALICSLASLLLTAPAHAAEDPYSYINRSGALASMGSLLAGPTLLSDELADLTGSSVNSETGFGFTARLGYRIFPLLGVEGNFDWIAGFKFESNGLASGLELEHYRNSQCTHTFAC